MAHIDHVDYSHPDHPHPTPEQHRERGKLRRAASDGTQAAVWVAFFVGLALSIALALAWGLTHRFSPQLPEVDPELPSLPGRTPQPQPP
jgi:hypothetical protein